MATEFQPFKRNATAVSIGQVSGEPLTWTAGSVATVGAASAELVPAGTGTGRTVWLKVPVSATTGICINYGAVATTSHQLIEPGETVFIPTEQQIRAIRAGAADVSVYFSTGVVA